MKWLIISITLTIASFCVNAQKKESKIEVYSVNFYTLTSDRVCCDEFLQSFERSVKYREITSIDTINMFSKYLLNIKYQKKAISPDVRAKLVYARDGQSDNIICLGAFDVLVNGKPVKEEESFNKFVRSLIPKEHLEHRAQTSRK